VTDCADGAVLGGLLLAKLYTPPEMLLALILMLVLRRDGSLSLAKLRDWNSAPPRAKSHGPGSTGNRLWPRWASHC